MIPRFAERNVYNFDRRTIRQLVVSESKGETNSIMKLSEQIKEAGAAGYMLLWLLGIPIPILLVIFLLRGCS